MKLTPEQKEARKAENERLKAIAEAMAERINSKEHKAPVDAGRRRYMPYNGFSKAPRTGQVLRRERC